MRKKLQFRQVHMGVREEDRLLSIPEGEISVIGTGVE